jgi:hypothetical protein
MLKLSIFVLALSTVATYAKASSLPTAVNSLVQAQIKGVASSSPQRSLEAAKTCADFSGAWEGTCQIKDKTQKISFMLTQKGCESISFDNDKIDLGHSKIESDNSILASASVQSAARFSQDGQTAKALGTLFVDSPFLPDTVSGRLGGELQKVGDELKIDGQIELWIGLKDLANVLVSCELAQAK